MDSEDILRGIVTMQSDIRELKKVNDEQDVEIKQLRERIRKYDTMATKAWGFGLGVIAVGVLLSTGLDVIRQKLLAVLLP